MKSTITLLLVGALIVHRKTIQAEFIDLETKEEDMERDVLCTNATLEIDFENLQINEIKDEFLSSPLIKCLKFKNNGISSVGFRAFEKLPNLKYLELSGNNFDINSVFLNNLGNLEILVVNGAHCADYVLRISGRYPKIRKMFLKNCGIYQNIEVTSKDAFPSLTDLYLSGNELQIDEFGWLPNTLETLDLSGHSLQSIRLTNFPHLRRVFISEHNYGNNRLLRNIHLENLPCLEYLDLTGHNLESITLNDLPRLKQLYISEHYSYSGKLLRDIHLSNLSSLESLSVASNSISEVSYSTFFNIPLLMNLDLSSNNIRYIEINALDSMQNLRYFNLSNNEMEIIQSGTFDKLSKLETLILEKNIITMFPPISNKMQLEIIKLNCNKIKSIVGGNFAQMSKLKSLYLHDNEISYIDQQAFSGLEKLKLLTLSNNKLSVLPDDWMTSLLSLEELDLIGNNFRVFDSLALSEISILKNVYLSNQIKIMHGQAMLTVPENITLNFDETFKFIETCEKDETKYSRQHYG